MTIISLTLPGPQEPLGVQVSRDPVGSGLKEPLGAWAPRSITDLLQIGPLGSLKDLKKL